MKFSERWLRHWVDPAIDSAVLADQLTMLGLEVDSRESITANFDGVVVAEILELKALDDCSVQLCQLATGRELPVWVVSGAPGLAVGLRVPYAPPGAHLPNGVVEEREIGGHLSRGMICSAEELSLGGEGSPLLSLPTAEPGTPLAAALELDDTLIELDVTPNRGDCFSLVGIAREVAARNQLVLSATAGGEQSVAPACDAALEVQLEAASDCPLFCGRVLKDIDPSAHTPAWMRERLRRSGLRSVNPVVDVTNYVMLEWGQPMHAYDLSQLHDPIVVRRARSGERLRLLDERELALTAEDLLIADQRQPLGLAGIMGGAVSSVTGNTNALFLEAAFFCPQLIARRSRELHLQTEASKRFERRVDPLLAQRAIERATALLLDIVGGRPGPLSVVGSVEKLPTTVALKLRHQRIAHLLGEAPTAAEVSVLLGGIGVALEAVPDGWLATVPSWRGDLQLEVDLIEEVARLRGYDRLPLRHPTASCRIVASAPHPATALRHRIAARGFFEVLNYSMAPATLQRLLHPDERAVELLHPLSQELGELRLSLWCGLLRSAQHNQRRGEGRLRLFELGRCFTPTANGEVLESEQLALLSCGSRWPENWSHAADRAASDVYDLKGEIQALLPHSDHGVWEFRASDSAALHPGRQATIHCDGKQVGRVGQLHPALVHDLELSATPCLAELQMNALRQSWQQAPLSVAPRSPALLRDLALVVPESMPAAVIEKRLRSELGSLLEHIVPFDIYRGEGIASDSKSLAFRLVLRRSEGALSEEEASAILDEVIAQLERDHGILLRTASVETSES